MVHLVC